ncbi:redoxin domain-containing protein [Synechococcus sp. CS-602]|uniref:thioredoxin domain-containing protein n=1 Tax=Synechococcaceae TaxID=1890426 RepID=UPI0008FF1986|nr:MULTISPECIES: thioredoxin domain-containing protein [Synechococcaceae]MCT4364949.1 thioredoxin domain-containing protein [Candidatus Regnicoccus frigidus MAG-AL1]APD49447.1 thioredoxin [Synechococcus sp. SynAce01]MCT0203451.1 redoxin domain-containing protein [Synechococcus sp. CS-603]MCT0204098.1 redoxin domain-containing protein [Synechococcus sp. CS-602]MCT0246670.1 redoxin domain-containing protein [Synechococcus sp. CS-601]
MGASNNRDPALPLLGRRERVLLAAIAAALGLLLFQLRGGLHPQAPLEQMARRSLELPVALANGRPTILEFYADWCEVCRTMAPAMEAIETEHRGAVDLVLLNVDNPRWSPEIERYGVNGIPQLEFFDKDGQVVGRSLGGRSQLELETIATALIDGTPLPDLAGIGTVSRLEETISPLAGPRSHG